MVNFEETLSVSGVKSAGRKSGVKESSKTELAVLLVKDLPSIAFGSRFTHFKGLYYMNLF